MRSRWARLAMRGLDFVLVSVALGIAINFASTPPLPPALRLVQHYGWWFLIAVVAALALSRILQRQETAARQTDPPNTWEHIRPIMGNRVRQWVDEVLVRSLHLVPHPISVSLIERHDDVSSPSAFAGLGIHPPLEMRY